MTLAEELRPLLKGEVLDDNEALSKYSHDASLFEIKPRAIVFPKDTADVEALVKFVSDKKKKQPELELSARAAGTDMTGGPLGESIVVAFEKYFNHIKNVSADSATAEPGAYYRDFEKETLKFNSILPSYPASREMCAMGGIVANNSGGEKTLKYGKTEDYIKEVRAVLSDGKEYVLKALTESELGAKLAQDDFEGDIYKKVRALIENNREAIEKARPRVSKNSAGYYLWNVIDRQKNTFDLSRLFVGSQGTLGLMTEATLRLVPMEKEARMIIVFLDDMDKLGEIVNMILPYKPESFESYDDNTLWLAIKFFPSFAKLLGAKNVITMGFKFLPEMWLALTGGIPKLVLQAEFTGGDGKELDKIVDELVSKLKPLNLRVRVARNKAQAQKYWLIRRESFNLLRHKIKNKHTAPFIDDIVVNPEKLPEFLPQLDRILGEYKLLYTLAGHIGNGNFHIIPLMNFADKSQRDIIPELSDKVYGLVLKFGGSITGEHNDGLIRSPYLRQMYGDKMYALFEEVKKIFDPQNIFNPGKKVGSSLPYALEHIKKD